MELLEKKGVTISPGTGFGDYPRCFRISLGQPQENLTAGVRKIGELLVEGRHPRRVGRDGLFLRALLPREGGRWYGVRTRGRKGKRSSRRGLEMKRYERRSRERDATSRYSPSRWTAPSRSQRRLQEAQARLHPGRDIVGEGRDASPPSGSSSGKRVKLLSIHPLFGPALQSKKGMKIAVIVGKERRQRRPGGSPREASSSPKPG